MLLSLILKYVTSLTINCGFLFQASFSCPEPHEAKYKPEISQYLEKAIEVFVK